MTTFNVSTNASLSTALANARGGDSILLATGTYSSVSINNLKFTQDVTIASANSAAPAVLNGLNISNSSGLTFQGLELNAPAPLVYWAFTVGSSSNISFTDLNVHGSLDSNPQNDIGGFIIRDSSNISITDSEFQQLGGAITHMNVNGLVIRGNDIHDIQTDGVQGVGSSNVVIDANTFRDFHPAAGDHPDAIQFFTTNSTTSAQNITITNNVIMRGDGAPMQGVFFGEEVGTLPYTNVTISGNFLAGTMYNGIALYNGRNVTVTDNYVVGFPDMDSWITLNKVIGGSLNGNAATSFILNTLTGVLNIGSTILPTVADKGAAAYQAWLTAHPDSTPAPPPPATQAPPPAASPFGGTAGADTIPGTSGPDSITGQGGNDSLLGGAGADTLDGGAGADTLSGGDGVNLLRGGLGDDLYFVSTGDTVVEDTAGASGGVDLVYAYGSFTLGANIENLQLSGGAEGIGNELANGIMGDSGANRLEGRAGADTLNARDGADTLDGGAGADLLIGGPGADRFVLTRGEANGDQISDFAGEDMLELRGYTAGSTLTKVAGSATDWKITDGATGSVEIIKVLNGYQLGAADLAWQGAAGAPTAPTVPAKGSIIGTAGADTLVGTAGPDSIAGLGGADSMVGGGGADTLDGGSGADTLNGGDGANLLRGGAGDDLYFVSDGDTVVEDTAGAAGGTDLVYAYTSFTLGPNIENLQLSGAAFGIGNELANGILGDAGANRLEGRAGADTLNARDGADTLDGGAGADLLIGGAGADRFVLARGEANGDQISDFAGEDVLQLSGYSAGSTIAKVAGSATDWKVVDAASGSIDIIKLLNGYQLGAGDYIFG